MKHLKKEGLTDQLSLLADSPVKTSQLQETEKESLEKDQVFGRSLRGSSQMYSRSGQLLKMYLPFDLKDLPWSYKISTRSGTMQNGIAYPVPQLVGYTEEIAYGSSPSLTWPTPRVSDIEGGLVKNVEIHNGKFSRKNKKGVRWGVKLKDAVNHVEVEKREMFATPNTLDHLPSRSKEAMDRLFAGHRKGRTKPNNLREQVDPDMWPTPSTRDYKGGYLGGRIRNGKVSMDTLDVAVQYTDNKDKKKVQLNPEWVEWLMGYPKDYTLPDEETK